MFIAIGAFILLIVFWYAVKRSRKMLYSDFTVYLNGEDFRAQIKKLTSALALPDKHGKGVDTSPLERYINGAYRVIRRKVAKGEELYEFEKWLYDNHYLFKRIFKASPFEGFFALPHAGDTPRAVVLARAVVGLSEGRIDADRVNAAVSEINGQIPLTFSEVEAFSASLQYALLEKLAAVSKKCVYYHKMLKIAVRAKNVAKKYVDNNLYVYYVIKRNRKLAEKLQGYMDANAKRYDDVDYAFSALIVENNVLTASLVTSLMNVSDATRDVFRLMPVWGVLEKEKSFKVSDEGSRRKYLAEIGRLSDKINLDEKSFAERLIKIAEGEPLCNLLFACDKNLLKSVKSNKKIISKTKKTNIGAAYVAVNIALTLAFAAAAGAAALSLDLGLTAAILGAVGLLYPANFVTNRLFSTFIKPRPVLTARNNDISPENSTEVIMPVFVKNAEGLKENIENLRRVAVANDFSNLRFTLLIDFARADKPAVEADDILIDTLKNLPDGINAAVRIRTQQGGGYSGYERKRGAIEQYAAYLMTGDDANFRYLSAERARPKYFVVLDADCTLAPSAILRLVNAFSHPMNASRDLLTLEGKTNLFSLKTLFSKRFAADGGREAYPCFSPFFYELTGQSIFTGKGIFRLDKYFLKLYGRLPENRILSHDIIEGALLDTATSGEAVYEDAPQSLSSYEDRRLRWQRGDIQLLPYLGLKKEDGQAMPAVSRYLIFLNAFKVFYEPYLLILFLLSAFTLSPNLAIFAAAVLSLEFIYGAVCGFFGIFLSRRIRYYLLSVVKNLYYLIESAVLLPYKALINAAFFVITVFRMTITKKGLLNWKPFAAGEKEIKPKKIPVKRRAELTRYAADAYTFFTSCRKDGLIADNFEYFPKGVSAGYTSPTNIGFSLLAEAAAYELGFISFDEAESRVTETLAAVDKLKKWNGHLYNWYDLTTKKPLPPSFVSSVDSGNYIASLLTIRGVFGKKTQKIIDNQIKNVNIKALFDDNRHQFYIGFNGDANRFEGHYDNLVSEARLLAYLGVCLGLPPSSWDTLSRDFTSLQGNTLLSWGGTAFEYLMSDLFISPTQTGLLKTTSRRAVKIMKRTKCKGLWGISESGYFDFDDNRNYKYQAFGVDNLSLKSELSKCVISPYSTFLSLEYSPRAALRNLKKLEKLGAYGEYGFYEAADFTSSPRIVLEYMAHHKGMSLLAIANYLTDGSLRKSFEGDIRVSSGKILLTEPPFEGKAQKPEKNEFIYEKNLKGCFERKIEGDAPQMNILRGGDYCLVLDNDGRGYGKLSDFDVTVFDNDENASCGAFFYVEDTVANTVSSPTRAPIYREGNYEVTFKNDGVTYRNLTAGLTENVYVPSFFSGEQRVLKIDNFTDAEKTYRVWYYANFCGNLRAAYAAHSAYSNLFVETKVKEGVLYAVRRSKERGRGFYAALTVKGCEPEFISNRMNFLGRKNTAANPDAVIKGYRRRADDNGTVLDPCLAFYTQITVPARGFCEIEVTTAASFEYAKLAADIKRAANPHFSELVKKVPFVEKKEEVCLNKRFSEYLSRLAPALIYGKYTDNALYDICLNHKLFQTISDGFQRKPILFVYDGNLSALRQAVGVINRLLSAGVAVSLVVSYVERDGYYTPVYREIAKEISGAVIGRDVFLLADADADVDILKKICFCDFSTPIKAEIKERRKEINSVSPASENYDCVLKTGEGCVSSRGYEVVPFSKNTLLPYSNVIGGEEGGTLVSDNGGYTYFANSRESKLTVWANDFVTDAPSEILLLETDKGFFDLTKGAHVTHGKGISNFYGEDDRFLSKMSQYIIEKGGAKVYEISLTAKKAFKGTLSLTLDLALGAQRDKAFIYKKNEGGILEAVNLKNGISCYMRAFDDAIPEDGFSAKQDINLAEGERGVYYFVFGGDFGTVADALPESIPAKKENSLQYFSGLNPFRISTGNKAFDILFNDCLAYQVVSARINARTSLYQAGGAIGFRDILQDLLALTYIDEERTRKILLDVASHVYFEGDVQHWWHGEKHGVRTLVSDDRLFLPYVVTEYIRVTGDESVLEEEVRYLESKPLSVRENSRYEEPDYHEKTDTLLLHLERITDSAYKTGENGLLLTGGGDWNDALNGVGTETAGESVWLTQFYIEVLSRMQELYEGKEKLPWLDRINRLKDGVSKAFTGHQFKRAVTASGEWLGDGYNKRYQIDMLPQAWASIARVCDKKYRDLSLNAAKNALFDKDNGIILLLSPPQTVEKYYGTISLYPEGVRENGGQYTHAAVWYIYALISEGRVDEAFEAFNAVNPLNKCVDECAAKKYMGEPYVLAADVYSNPQHKGRAGWTWYTGSAAWLYKVMLEGFLGVKIERGCLTVNPKPPSAFDSFSVEYRRGDSVYLFEAERRGRRAFFENGVEISAAAVKINDGEKRTFKVFY